MTERIFGLDGEMSGAESDTHQLIQIGVAVDTDPDGERLPKPEWFVSTIGWSEQELVWDERAAKVHRFSYEEILAAPPAYEVDAALVEWLLDHGARKESRRNQIICGFNVGAFDAPFMKRALPRSFEYFSRRYADLNPLNFMLAASNFGVVTGGQLDTAAWKRRMRSAGIEYARIAGCTEEEHDAGMDALQALGAWRHIETLLSGCAQRAVRESMRERAERLQASSLKCSEERTILN